LKILLDNNLDWRLGRELAAHQVGHVLDLGWAELKNGELVREKAATTGAQSVGSHLTI